jgi:hypothetical protein
VDIQIQNVSRAPELPVPGPLSYLNPAVLQGVDSGVAATAAGQQIGLRTGEQEQAAVQPLANMGLSLAEYESPQSQAQRQQAIAQANLGTTNATQQNNAAVATPTLPLAERSLALAQAQGQTQLVGPQVGLTLANIGSEEKQLPSKTLAAVAGNTAAQQAATNTVNTTPNFPNAADGLSEPQMVANAQAVANKIQEALDQKQAMIAGNPLYSGLTGTTMGAGGSMREGFYNDAGKLSQDKPVAFPGTMTDPTTGQLTPVTGIRWEHGGFLSPDALQQYGMDPQVNDSFKTGTSLIAPRAATIQNTQNMAAARSGALAPGQGNATVQALNQSNQYDYTNDPDESLPKNVAARADAVAKDLSKLPNIQTAMKITPSIDDAIQNFQNSKTSASGVPAKEAVIQAAKAFAGGVPTNTEIDQLQQSQGLPAQAANILRGLQNGDWTAPTTKDDYIAALNQVKQIYANQAMSDVKNMTPSLDVRARPFAPQIFAKAYPGIRDLLIPPGVGQQPAVGASTAQPATTQAAQAPLTATGAHGEKYILQNNQWVQAGGQ